MAVLLHPRPAALLQSAQARYPGGEQASRLLARLRRSPALASLSVPLLLGGVVSAIVVAALQLSVLGPVGGFFLHWLENWLLTWAIAFPVAYLAGPSLIRLVRFVSSPAPAPAPQSPRGLAFTDIASASARASDRHGFSVLRNLKVREDFYSA
jgi:hypothetical protein